MSVSRRAFLHGLGVAGAGAVTGSLIAARGREAWAASWWGGDAAPDGMGRLILSSNENPLGPGDKVLAAVLSALDGGNPGRYPRSSLEDLTAAVARSHGLKPENVLLGCGSTQILRTVTHVFTSRTRPLVGSLPTYEECSGYAELVGAPVRGVPLDGKLRIDLEATLAASSGAGLVFFCNPNNPTATLHPAAAVSDFADRLLKGTRETAILIDEAYHDYVTDPSHKSQIGLAVENPRVIVARTFSKAHGMAGLRIGYAVAHPRTIKALSDWDGLGNINCLAVAAALASLADPARIERERARNAEARAFTIDFFEKAGYKASESQTNFLFVDVRRPAKDFREACKPQGVIVARDFPPLEKSHVRISIGTLDQMRRATEVFRRVLASPAQAAAA